MTRQVDDALPLPHLPRDEDGPVFTAPWQAQAFAMAMALRDRGVFTWEEWGQRLNAEIAKAQAGGDPDHGDTYYRHWLAALEGLAIDKGTMDSSELADRQAAWERAARATPHGQPIELGAETSPAHD